MSCPKCKSEEIGTVWITKGDKVIGQNVFCKEMDCRWEMDRRARR